MPLRVLSLDMDYFLQVSKEQSMAFPSGRERSPKQSVQEWNACYAKTPELRMVTINPSERTLLRRILDAQTSVQTIGIGLSHREIIPFLQRTLTEQEPVTLVNVDMHHDLFNENEELDCGNWISYLMAEHPTNLTWIANPVSKTVYGLQGERFDCIPTSLSEIPKQSFDAIFLCRSDSWFPPHLDKEFQCLAAELQCLAAEQDACRLWIQNEALTARWSNTADRRKNRTVQREERV